MGPDDIRELASAGESLTVEFKSEHGHDQFSDDKFAEAVVCLSNGGGGTLLVGIEDNGQITGVKHRHGESTNPMRLQAMIANKTVPPVVTEVAVVDIDGRSVIAVTIPPSATVTGTARGLYVRRGLRPDGHPECMPFPAHEMLADRIERGEIDYAAIAEPLATLEDLDPREFDRMRRLVTLSSGGNTAFATLSDFELGRALSVIEGREDAATIRRGALLLFGKPESIHRFLPTHETAFQVVEDTAVKQNIFAHDPLLKSAENLFEQLQRYNDEEEIEIGLTRVAVPRIPPVAARELIANALVHRDYTMLGPVSVQLRDAELTISNPGGFPRGVTLDNFLTTSRPRSRILSEAFFRAGLVERTGRGINRVFEWTLLSGRTAPDFSRTDATQVVVSLPTGQSDLAIVKFVVEHDERSGRHFSLGELQIVHALLDDPRLTVGELARLTQASEIATRSTLARLVESGIVEMRGNGRGRRYALSAAAYRTLSTKSGYVHVLSFDEMQQEQMVISYVRSHGRITRREAAELCSISSEDAKTLLRGMRDKKLLIMVGDRRSAYYTEGSN
jgi:ATP-dependent DNA helicase RecG